MLTKEQKNRRRWFRRRGWRTDTRANGETWLQTPVYGGPTYTDRAFRRKWIKQARAAITIRNWHHKGVAIISVYTRDWYIEGPMVTVQKDTWPGRGVKIWLTAEELKKIAEVIEEEKE